MTGVQTCALPISDIDYALAVARTKVGALGIKVWICNGERYGKQDLTPNAMNAANAQAANARPQRGERRGGDRRGGDRGDRGDRRGGRGRRDNAKAAE